MKKWERKLDEEMALRRRNEQVDFRFDALLHCLEVIHGRDWIV